MVRTIIWADKKYNNMPIVYSFEGKSDNSAEKKIGEFLHKKWHHYDFIA